ncbi:cytochrome c-type biogenesis protein CcmH [Paraglaciecola sp. 2405UD69-4]|uniref:cytochrome c-type biogenesis protein n=1 Tax=Paraglaciecola sp. 2405UD69-4 TaxID=3391836 RepID=UPI0039C914B5
MKVTQIILLVFMLATSWGAFATEDKFYFEDPQQQALFIELTKELRCPKCQNQNIADSDAMIAVDLKRKVYQLLQQGQSKEQVISFMKQRYGDFVYYQPPVNSMTIWLWLLPLFFICIAIAGIVIGRRKQAAELDYDKLKRAKALLESDE